MDRNIYATMQQVEKEHWWFVSRRLIISKTLKSFTRKSIENSILEIGCGSGGNLEMLQQYGEVSTMELDDMARDAANEKKICKALKGSLPDNIPYDEKFDVVCMLDVLEHIEQDKEALKAICLLLHKNSKLVLTVPAYSFLWGPHDVVHHHYRRYRRGKLVELLDEHGFHVEFSSYFNTFLFPGICIARFMERLFNKKNTGVMKQPSGFLNSLLEKIFSFEASVLSKLRLPFGVSILVVAKPQ